MFFLIQLYLLHTKITQQLLRVSSLICASNNINIYSDGAITCYLNFADVMMAFAINSVVRGYNIYKDIGVLKLIQSYHAVQSLVSYAVAEMNGTHVHHMTHENIFYLSSISTSFLRREFIFVESPGIYFRR